MSAINMTWSISELPSKTLTKSGFCKQFLIHSRCSSTWSWSKIFSNICLIKINRNNSSTYPHRDCNLIYIIKRDIDSRLCWDNCIKFQKMSTEHIRIQIHTRCCLERTNKEPTRYAFSGSIENPLMITKEKWHNTTQKVHEMKMKDWCTDMAVMGKHMIAQQREKGGKRVSSILVRQLLSK